MVTWGDLNARARGLGAHLLPRDALARLADAPDLAQLTERLRAVGFAGDDTAASDAAALEALVRREAGRRLRALARWCGPRADLLTVVFEDEDRRSLRALLRGAARGAAPEHRLAGLIPTPGLPTRALAELARQPSVARLVTLLTAWKHPYGAALQPGARASQPDLLVLELALAAAYFARALRAARRAGRGGPLLVWVRELVDTANASTALVLAAQPDDDLRPQHAFLAGGTRLPIGAFEEAVATHDAEAAALRLAAAFRGTDLEAVYRAALTDPAGVEEGLLRAWIARFRAAQRRDPLDVHLVLHFALRLRAEALDLRRIIWGVALGAPGALLAGGLVST